jgi:hypothetical protein
MTESLSSGVYWSLWANIRVNKSSATSGVDGVNGNAKDLAGILKIVVVDGIMDNLI